MKTVFLVEDSIKGKIPLSNFVDSHSIYVGSRSELIAIDGQVVRSNSTKLNGSLVDGFILGAITKSAFDGRVDEELHQRITEVVPPELRDELFFLISDRQQTAEFVAWLIRRYSLFAKMCAQHSATSDLTLAELRKLFLETQKSLRVAEQQLSDAAVPRILLVECVESDDFSFRIPPTANDASFALSQVSFRPLHSLRRVDLQFQVATGTRAGLLHVEACGAYSRKTIEVWTRSNERINNGWNTFERQSEIILDEPVQIKVSWRGSSEGPYIGMGSRVLDKSFAATLQNGEALQRSIARRLWKSRFLSAEQIVREAEKFTAIGAERVKFSADYDEPGAHTTASDLLSMAAYYDGPTVQVPHVLWRADKSALLVHPAGKRPMIAHIKDVEVGALRRITARVHLDHPEAETTAFALFALPQAEVDKHFALHKLGAFLFSELDQTKKKLAKTMISEAQWLSLKATESGEVFFQFKEPYTGPIELFLATRNLDSSARYSWGFFESLKFACEGLQDARS
jgi:hypothetical protein